MSINLRFAKFIAILSFLLAYGVQENGVPNFILLTIFFLQFLNDLFSNTSSIFWEGLIAIPTSGLLVLFLRSRNYKILLSCFVIVLFILINITGLLYNYHRINFTFTIPVAFFFVSSVYAIILAKKERV